MAATNPAADAPVDLEITNVAHGGVFVARHEGRVVFVSDAIPGERVRARITDDRHAGFWRAETLEVLDASPHRREHVWPEASVDRDPAERAGGAEFGHIELAHQRELKRQVLTDALSRMAALERDVEVEPVPGDDAANGLGWRTRVSLHVDENGTVGPYAARSHRVIPVASLPLATEAVRAAAPLAETFPGAASVDVVQEADGSAHVLVRPERQTRPERHARSQRRGHREPREREEPVLIREQVAGRDFRLDAQGFWQVHRGAADTLYRAVQQAVAPDAFDPQAANLDLYGGVGLLAAALGDRFGAETHVTSVESSRAATGFAAENLSEWAGAGAVTDRTDRYLQRLIGSADAAERSRLHSATVILDPPRSGAGKTVVAQLAELSPAQVVYVACDPVALARDIALFAARGYELRTLRAFDLFPHTHHVEAIATLAPAE
jgi:tRNA/tmRNA/rRNA uracil-C5-methylase (TrmA/RlmC/RlmD family)